MRDADTCHIQLAGAFATADLDRLAAALAPLDELRDETLATVDLSGVTRISAPSVAVLVATLLEVSARGVIAPGSAVIHPDNPAVQEHLEQLDVVEVLSGMPTEGLDRLRERGSRPCQVVRPGDDPGEVALGLTEAMREVCSTDGPASNATWFALNEIAQNVIDHSDALGGGVAVAEVTSGGREFEVAMADHGIGVRQSLARNPIYRELSSDLDALRTALQAGVTALPEKPGGFGLFVTQVLLRQNGGGMMMRSGDAHLDTGSPPEGSFGHALMRGTLVSLRFRTDSPFSLEPILSVLDKRPG
jgi:anti-sigma regulatory factor (Ser/Thr protein kinase)